MADRLKDKKILLLEPDTMLGMGLIGMLKREGAIVKHIGTVGELKDELKREKPSLIIAEMLLYNDKSNLEDMSNAIVALKRETPLIFHTTQAREIESLKHIPGVKAIGKVDPSELIDLAVETVQEQLQR